MIPDLRRRLVSKLRAPKDCTDAQLIEHAGNVVERCDAYLAALQRAWLPRRKPCMALKNGDHIVETDDGEKVSGAWTVVELGWAEDGITIGAARWGSTEVKTWIKRAGDEVLVLKPGPEGVALAELQEELGARFKGVGEP